MAERVSIDDLGFAADWIEAYDGQEDDENNERAARLGAWLRVEIARREHDARERQVVRQVAAATGRSIADVKVAQRRIRVREAAQATMRSAWDRDHHSTDERSDT